MESKAGPHMKDAFLCSIEVWENVSFSLNENKATLTNRMANTICFLIIYCFKNKITHAFNLNLKLEVKFDFQMGVLILQMDKYRTVYSIKKPLILSGFSAIMIIRF